MALLQTAAALRPLYPVKKALTTGKHIVDGGVHKLYYEEHGTAAGAPALFLHGGPGAGCFQRHAGFFDPDHYRVLLFDQRGSGRSVPKGCLDGNETPQLIADIEELRVLLGIEAWQVVLGGSWGTTLALAYAQAHPSRVRSLVLRAVCLMRQREIRWLFGARGGAAQLHPAGWQRFSAAAPGRKGMAAAEVELEDEIDEEAALRCYAGAMRDGEAAAASEWGAWEGAISSMGARLQPCPTPTVAASSDGSPALLTRALTTAEASAAAAATATIANIAANTAAAAAAVPAAAAAAAATADAGSWAWVPQLREWRLCETTAAAPSEVRLDAAAVADALGTGFRPRVAAALRQPMPPPPPPPSPAAIEAYWTAAAAARNLRGAPSPPGSLQPSRQIPTGAASSVPAQALLTSHYSVHYGFLEDEALLEGVERIRHIPCVAVQGANDLICPPSTALELHRAWPEMELRVCAAAGHSMYSAQLQAEVLRATDAFRTLE